MKASHVTAALTAAAITLTSATHTLHAQGWNAAVGDALNNTSLWWTTPSDSDASWSVQTAVTHDGVSALRSGPIGDDQHSAVQTTVTGPGILSFWWRVSSEQHYDRLNFYIDDAPYYLARISGSTSWELKRFDIPSGAHTLKWSYEKDGSGSDGSDCGWLDEVMWSPCFTVTLDANGGSLPDPQTFSVEPGFEYGWLPEVERPGYAFTGWYTARSGGTQVTPGTLVTASDSHTLYAHWTDCFTYYVDATYGNDGNDGFSWATAKRSIQAALDMAFADGITISVTNGVYAPIWTDGKMVTIQSVNGAEHTAIDGGGTNRCATLGGDYYGELESGTDSVLTGFTLRNGDAWRGGGACGGTLNNCILAGNTANEGGGAYYGTLNNCVLTDNTASYGGGGAHDSTLNNCLLSGNTAGGPYWDDYENEWYYATGYGGGANYSTLYNCTVADNTADYYGGVYGSTVYNSIVWGNTAYEEGNNWEEGWSVFYYSCTTPLPPDGMGNIDGDPLFAGACDFSLSAGSPCINAGMNRFADWDWDVAGNPRIQGGQVDMGAYESEGEPPGALPVVYVDNDRPDDSGDGQSWATAKKTIQAAAACVASGGEIIVTNGTYAPIVTFGGAMTIRSVNGAEHTFIDGGGTNRCATLGWSGSDGNTVLTGFTLHNGYAYDGGGAYGGTLNDCMLTGNTAEYEGGGTRGSVLNDCTLTGNTAYYGGGAYGGTLHNYCTVSGNTAEYGGGACYSVLTNCTVSGNKAVYSGGGAHGGTLCNCLLTDNTAGGRYWHNYEYLSATGYGGGAYYSTLHNCTVAHNSADYSGGVRECDVYNSIVYLNTAHDADDNWDAGRSVFYYSCTTPLPPGIGNIDGYPWPWSALGNFRLPTGSPCINAGMNLFVDWAADLDGNPRIQGGTVDMGAYEYEGETTGPLPVVYVDERRLDNSGDGQSWGTAKKTIQAAIACVASGGEIIVTNGTYAPFDTFSGAMTIRSVNGVEHTFIDGGGTNRCATLDRWWGGTDSVLDGFTLTNGRTSEYGGGAYGGTLTNCTVSGNTAYCGGGAYGGTLNNCTVSSNTAYSGGGAYSSTLYNCTVVSNTASSYGGGACYGTLHNCTVSSNTAYYGGGTYSSTLYNCTVSSNTAYYGGGAYNGSLHNCTVSGNRASSSGGGAYYVSLDNCAVTGNMAYYGGGAYNGWLNNCTVAGNTASYSGGGVYNCDSVYNSIVWGNTGGNRYGGNAFYYSCTTPLPTSNRTGSIEDDPLFVDAGNGNFRLQAGSPCIDMGDNGRTLWGSDVDLDGHPRIQDGRVDMGAYEFTTVFTNNPTVTFDAQEGGSVSPASITVTTGQPYGALPEPTRPGYVFEGWSTARTGGTEVTAATLVSANYDHRLYARWNIPAFGAALDNTSLAWTTPTGSDAPWFVQTTVKHTGDSALQSGPIGHNRHSDVQATVTGPGTLKFWWLVSSEPRYDCLIFSIDNAEQARISGAPSWKQIVVGIPAGTHTLKWSYEKDGNSSVGSDCGWLDEVTWAPWPPPANGFTETQNSPVPVPHTWLDRWGGTPSTYEDLAVERGANGYYFWESYEANLNPTLATNKLRITVFTTDGTDVTGLQWAPDFTRAPDPDRRVYEILGKTNLTDTADWAPTNSAHRFFRVRARLP